MAYTQNSNILENKTKYLDPRIKQMDLYKLCRANYVNQTKYPCNFSIDLDSCIVFRMRKMVNHLQINHSVLQKNVICMKQDYGLTYTENREFNSHHHIVNLNIKIEFMYSERITISAEKKSYGVLFSSSHEIYSSSGYQEYAKIPCVSLSNFDLIPFDVVFEGCHPETIELFEDYYSGTLYLKRFY